MNSPIDFRFLTSAAFSNAGAPLFVSLSLLLSLLRLLPLRAA